MRRAKRRLRPRAREKTRRPGRDARRDRLFEIASEQAGYFTRQQACACGFSDSLLSHHVHHGTFVKMRRGLYRFRQFPSSPREEVMVAWLTMGPESVIVSHESALKLLGLSDVLPNRIHLLVPRVRRGRRAPPGVALRTTLGTLHPQDVVIRNGMRVAAPVRAIVDAAAAGVASEQLEMAVRQAIERGLTTSRELRRAAGRWGVRVQRLVEGALVGAGAA